MIKKKVTVKNPSGIHARPAALLVREISKYKSDFNIHMHGYCINGKSILGLLTLAADQGAELELELDGPDEEEAMEMLVRLFNNGFSVDGQEK